MAALWNTPRIICSGLLPEKKWCPVTRTLPAQVGVAGVRKGYGNHEKGGFGLPCHPETQRGREGLWRGEDLHDRQALEEYLKGRPRE
jgi:hypothetical protein